MGFSIGRSGTRAYLAAMTKKPIPAPKLTDAERHARFVETARQVGVDESPEAFDRAFDRLKVKEQTTRSGVKRGGA
jgi:hypothetical protein